MSEGKTTVEVTHEIWAALDKRKERGESFNDVIHRLIDNTPAPVGAIKEDAAIQADDFERAPDANEGCYYFNAVSGEQCGEPAEWKQRVYYGEDDDGDEMYFCDDHGPAAE
jgi:hypothetical protein